MNHPLMARVHAASELVAACLNASPLLCPDTLCTPSCGRLWIKAESLMPTGSFKIRGATWRLSQLTTEERQAGVIAYSTGNHAQAVARAAHELGVSALIVMSPDVPRAKLLATTRWGAQVVMAEPNSHARKVLAERLAADCGRVMVPPYDDDEIIAGQATIGVELVQQWRGPPPSAVFVPIGGGGLIAGVALAVKHLAQGVAVVGVEPEWEDDAVRSWEAGHIVAASAPSASVADAIKVQRVGDRTFPFLQRYVDAVVRVTEDEIAIATRRTLMEGRLLLEPAGAVAIAAAMKTSYQGDVVAIASGGNISVDALQGFIHPEQVGQ